MCLDDGETLQLRTSAAEDFARAPEVSKVFFSATLIALQKEDGGVRGIATGSSFRRMVAKTSPRQFSSEVETACAPFQFALSTRGGTDCVEHAVFAAADLNPQMTVLSIEGIGAYDHVCRSSMLAKLLEILGLHGLLPFVRPTYVGESCYTWVGDGGLHHDIRQAEGESKEK